MPPKKNNRTKSKTNAQQFNKGNQFASELDFVEQVLTLYCYYHISGSGDKKKESSGLPPSLQFKKEHPHVILKKKLDDQPNAAENTNNNNNNSTTFNNQLPPHLAYKKNHPHVILRSLKEQGDPTDYHQPISQLSSSSNASPTSSSSNVNANSIPPQQPELFSIQNHPDIDPMDYHQPLFTIPSPKITQTTIPSTRRKSNFTLTGIIYLLVWMAFFPVRLGWKIAWLPWTIFLKVVSLTLIILGFGIGKSKSIKTNDQVFRIAIISSSLFPLPYISSGNLLFLWISRNPFIIITEICG